MRLKECAHRGHEIGRFGCRLVYHQLMPIFSRVKYRVRFCLCSWRVAVPCAGPCFSKLRSPGEKRCVLLTVYRADGLTLSIEEASGRAVAPFVRARLGACALVNSI
eukprot:scaffold318267_cov27-Tisochrysis_lutea.AAC.3